MHTKQIIYAGKSLKDSKKALIMIHGRGGSAEDILSLSNHLDVDAFALLAPQATNHTWYPLSFLAPPKNNEPALSSALHVLTDIVDDVVAAGINKENIYFLGFSQGACLTLEFVTRNAHRYGGVIAFTGGLIGDHIYAENYKGNFADTPILIGTSNPDPHVPVERVKETAKILEQMNADLTLKIYDNMGHTISKEEIDLANQLIFNQPK